MPAPTPATKLDAVNLILASIGEAPFNTLEGSLSTDAAAALNLIEQKSREVQSWGWRFNTEDGYTVTRDIDGKITLSDEILTFILDRSHHADLVIAQRGRKLRNLTDHSYVFEANLTGRVVLLLDFDELPEEAKTYIVYLAGRDFQSSYVGSRTLDQFAREDEYRALAALKRQHALRQRISLKNSPGIRQALRRR